MPKRIAVLVTHEFEDAAYSEPIEAFRAASHSVLNIEKQSGKIIHGKQYRTVVTIDRSIDEISIQDFDALMIPGGHSPFHLSQDARFIHFVRAFVHAEKPIFSICHAPILLAQANVIQQRRLTAIQPLAKTLTDAGAIYYDAELVNDNNLLISSRQLEDLPVFIHECLSVLKI